MRHVYSSISFVDYSARFDKACRWLGQLGIDYSKTRVGRYKTLFSTLSRHQLANTLEKFYDSYSLDEWINAVHEAAELIRIYEGLVNENDGLMIERLKDALKGHELFVLDNADRSGRDFSFELSIAVDFSSSGCEIDFGDTADLKVKFQGRDLYVECKRLKSQKQIRHRIKHGLRQLHKRYSDSMFPERSRGLLVLSIGKLINSKLGLLEAHGPAELGNLALAQNRKFIEQNGDIWQGRLDRRTLGVIVVLDTPAKLTSNQQLTSCHEVSVNNSSLPNSENDLLLRTIVATVFANAP